MLAAIAVATLVNVAFSLQTNDVFYLDAELQK
jgi:hypothetical protein